jgi:hypothetical protein
MRASTPFDVLYNTALLEIAQTLQKNGLIERSAWYARRHGGSSLVLDVRITVRVVATRKLYDTLMKIMSAHVTCATVLAGVNQGASCKSLGMSFGEFEALLRGGMPHVMEYKRNHFALKLIKHGVQERTAKAIVAHVILRRDEILEFLNTVDDVGCERQTKLAPPGP